VDRNRRFRVAPESLLHGAENVKLVKFFSPADVIGGDRAAFDNVIVFEKFQNGGNALKDFDWRRAIAWNRDLQVEAAKDFDDFEEDKTGRAIKSNITDFDVGRPKDFICPLLCFDSMLRNNGNDAGNARNFSKSHPLVTFTVF
jgi:hypothetical protein